MMKVVDGILPGQVLQRDKRNMGGAVIRGTCRTAGRIEARLLGVRRSSRHSGWQESGSADGGRFECRLGDIPAGGPYNLELRAGSGRKQETLVIEPIFVGDVWVLAGQSNMAGSGELNKAPKPHPLIRCFSMADDWREAADPLHFTAEATDMVHHALAGLGRRPTAAQVRKARRMAVRGVGLGVFFARDMRKRTRVPQGLIPCAHGGTSTTQWSPALKDEGGDSLYGAMVRRVRMLGQPVAGLLWYQGESDRDAADGFTDRMVALVESSRRDFGLPKLPWVVVQIGRVLGDGGSPRGWNSIQEQQRLLPERVYALDVVPAVDCELGDNIHLSAAGFERLARRVARVASRLAHGSRVKGAIQPRAISWQTHGEPDGRVYSSLEVSFSNVTGRLISDGAPVGFSLGGEDGSFYDMFYRTRLSGNRAILETYASPVLLETMSLHYGQGCNPVVTIHDREDMAVPVFGPMRITERLGTEFMRSWQSRAIAKKSLPQALRGVSIGREGKRGTWRRCETGVGTASFMAFPAPIDRPRTGTYLMRGTVTAARACDVVLAAGGDSPFKVWLNGKEALSALSASNPCVPDQVLKPVQLRKGKNELLVAFDTRGGLGWGVCVRFKSVDKDGRIEDGLIEV